MKIEGSNSVYTQLRHCSYCVAVGAIQQCQLHAVTFPVVVCIECNSV